MGVHERRGANRGMCVGKAASPDSLAREIRSGLAAGRCAAFVGHFLLVTFLLCLQKKSDKQELEDLEFIKQYGPYNFRIPEKSQFECQN